MHGPVDLDVDFMEPEAIPSSLSPRLHDQWTRAVLGTNQADPFCCTPVWQLSFHDAFSPKRRLLIKESSGNVLAFAEKVFGPENIVLTPIEPHWFFGCPLLGRQSVDFLAETIGGIEKLYAPFFPKIVISGIRPGGVLAKRLVSAFASSFQLLFHCSGVQCAASLAGGIDGYLSRRSGNHRGKMKRQKRRAMEQGVWFERIVPATPEESAETFARMLAVEKESWKGHGQCGMDQEPATSFYRIMLSRLASSKSARVVFARHEEKDIGYVFGGLAGSIYRGQQFSYVEDWRELSIGNVLQAEQIAWLCEEGTRRYDMGPLQGNKMEYKTHWTEKEMRIETWILSRR